MVGKLKLLGVDAAFSNTGLVVAEFDIHTNQMQVLDMILVTTEADKANKKTVRKNSDDLRRAGQIIRTLDEVLMQYNPQFAIVEVPSGTQSARSSWALGIAVGCIAHLESKVPIVQVSPMEVKNVVSTKHPDKSHMIAWAVDRYPDAPWPRKAGGGVTVTKAEHLADAVAALHAGVQTNQFQSFISMMRTMR